MVAIKPNYFHCARTMAKSESESPRRIPGLLCVAEEGSPLLAVVSPVVPDLVGEVATEEAPNLLRSRVLAVEESTGGKAATTSTPKRSIPFRPAVKAPLTAKANTPTRSIRWRYMHRQVSSEKEGMLSPRDRFSR
jgi:hypothetical protein